MSTFSLSVNGKRQEVRVAPNTPLLWVLRDAVGLTGTKYGCGMGLCGACTVHLDGEPVRSCQIPVSGLGSKKITTIEGLSENRTHPLQRAWIAEQVPQCGYCQSGQIMQAAALLAKKPHPTKDEIDQAMTGNICRCATYQRIRRAIERAEERKYECHSNSPRSDEDRRGSCFGPLLPVGGRTNPADPKLNAWISIAPDSRITLFTETPEMGQGTRTANAMMLAEELEVDWSAIQVEQAAAIPAIYKHLTTGGSGGTASTCTPLRQAGAQVREVLLAAAAQRWNARKVDCRAENGTIIHIPTSRSIPYGELVEIASKLPVPSLDTVTLKDAKDFRILGKPMPRVDVPAKVDGSAVFGLDVRVPGCSTPSSRVVLISAAGCYGLTTPMQKRFPE